MNDNKEENNDELPHFTSKEKLILRHFILNGNNPRYPTKIEKELNGQIARQTSIDICKKFHEMGLFDYKMIKPPRTKNKTENYFLNNDINTFYKIAYTFLTSTDFNEQKRFLRSTYVQDILNDNFIRTLFHLFGFNKTITYDFNDLPNQDQERFHRKFNEFYSKDGERHYAFFKSIPVKEKEKFEIENPDTKVSVHSKMLINITYPIFPLNMKEKEKRKLFNQANNRGKHTIDTFYEYYVVKDYYYKEKKDLKPELERFLVLIQISPRALFDVLYENIFWRPDLKEGDWFEESLLDNPWMWLSGNIEKIAIPRLVTDTIYDLIRSPHLPKDSLVEEARVLLNPDSLELTEPILKLILSNGNEYSYNIGFVLDKNHLKGRYVD